MVAKYMSSILSTDSKLMAIYGGTVQLYNEGAPHGAGNGPYTVFNIPAGIDSNTLDGNRILVPGDVNIVTCVQDLGYGAIKAAADRIDAIMTSVVQVTFGGIFITKYVRKATVMMSDSTDDIYWYYLGGMYEADIFEYSPPGTGGLYDPGGAFGDNPLRAPSLPAA